MKILFIGAGNMGGAILKSILNSAGSEKYEIFVAKKSESTYNKLKTYGEFNLYEKKQLSQMDIIFLGVKPYQMEAAVKEHLLEIKDNQIVISMAAGVTLEKLESLLGRGKKIVRIMPNIPIVVGEGMTSITPNENISGTDLETVIEILEMSSRTSIIPESKIHGFIGMAGSSPAFGYIFLEAMADAGVRAGLTREESYRFAAQALLGASKMVLESPINPGALKDSVCSPGGTTIEGVCTLEEEGFRNAIIKAVTRTVEKSILMSK